MSTTVDTLAAFRKSSEMLAQRYERIREATMRFAAPLSPDDCQGQSMADASPVKWHLAHTTWFFETFVLASEMSSYRPVNSEFRQLFNSYYNTVSHLFSRPNRGSLTRPGLEEVKAFRQHVDEAMSAFLQSPEAHPKALDVVELGMHHEQQHQELMVTDFKHLLSINPLRCAYHVLPPMPEGAAGAFEWCEYDEGVYWTGFDGSGFAFDNESPRHRVFLDGFCLANRLVTNGDYLDFMADGGYTTPQLWLSDGWAKVRAEEWRAPLYWTQRDDGWEVWGLTGVAAVRPDEPVCHVSFYEADAFARWAGARLPTESEWEVAAVDASLLGNFSESGRYHPVPLTAEAGGAVPAQLFGDVWEWTQSPYAPYPGYAPAAGALGEYNAKFMANQMVLRGGSCATSETHIRPTYRNFFYPDARWQFTGVRLARDAG